MNILKAIRLGVKDYCEDCWHDWLADKLQNVQGERVYTYEAEQDEICWVFPWKKGNLWYYIKQAKLSKRKENAKNNH